MPHQIERRLTVTETGGGSSDDQSPAPVPELKANTMLGLKGWMAVWAQFGAVGVVMGLFTIGAYYWRQDINTSRQDDREDRARERLDDRERLKERDDRLRDHDEVQNRILQALSIAIDGQRIATTELKTEIRDMKTETRATTAAVEDLNKTLKEKK